MEFVAEFFSLLLKGVFHGLTFPTDWLPGT